VTSVATSVRMLYPKILDDEQIVRDVTYCKLNHKYAQDQHWVAPRCDKVLVQYNKGANDETSRSTMNGQRVARLQCLFKVNAFNGKDFAFVQWFRCDREPEEDTGMFVVMATEDYEVIELETIERSVHLILDFGSTVGSTEHARKRHPQGLDIGYKKFVINNHVNLENYNWIF
jgi:hypothetical protein